MKCKKLLVLFLLILAACGTDGGDGVGISSDGVTLKKSGTVTPTAPAIHTFGAMGNHAYSARLVSKEGDADLFMFNQPPSNIPSSNSTLVAYSWSSGVDDLSFISPSNMTVYAWVNANIRSTYDLQIFHNHLAVEGTERTRQTKSKDIYFSFDAVAGQAYNVKVTPVSGDPRLRVYSDARTDGYAPAGWKPDGLIATSNNLGMQTESVVFVATKTKTHYLEVSNTDTSVDMTFSVAVKNSEEAADLQVSINSLTYNNGNLTVNYTVSNTGVAYSTGVNLHFYLDAETPPTSDSVAASQIAINAIAPGASSNGSRTISTGGMESGTFYAYVDPENILREADETNNVSTGWYWAAPVHAPQSFDFDDGLKPAAVTFSGNADWHVVLGGAGDSAYSFRSGTITANQTSCFQVSVNGVAAVIFDWKALTDYSTDSLKFYVDGYSQATYSGADIWQSKTHSHSSSSLRTYKWCYTKGSSDNLEVDDGGWVDNIVFQPELPDLSVILNSISSDGTDLSINYTIKNNSGAAAASTTIDFWADLAMVPTVGSAGVVQLSVPVIAGNGSYTGTATVPSTGSGGTAYAIVDTNNTLSEKNENNNVSAGMAWLYFGTPLISYDFEDGTMPADFVASGSNGWQIDATTASSGSKSIRASTITHSQSACIAVTAENSSVITFDWKVSSESNWDSLRFYIDGMEQSGRISGTADWTGKTFFGLPVGTHEYKWCYTKDNSISAGSDTGWLDNVRIY